MVGGGFPGRKCVGVKKWNCGGPPPCRALVETLNNYLNVLGYGSLGFFAEKQSVAEKPICAPFRWREHGPVSPQRGKTLARWNPIWPTFLTLRHLLCQEGSLLKKERLFLCWGPVGLKCRGRLGAAMPGSEGFPAPRATLLLPKWGCGSSQNRRQSPVAPSAVGRRRAAPASPCSPSPASSAGAAKGPWGDQAPNLGTSVNHLKSEGMSLGPGVQITPVTAS